MKLSRTCLPFIIVCIVACNNLFAQSNYTNTPTPASETMVGIDSYADDFIISVGNAGQIMHINAGNSTLVASGTTENLFSVHIVDKNFAVASGIDYALLWDGTSWSTIFENTNVNESFITPIWSPSAKNKIYYQFIDTSGSISPFHVLCSYNVADPGNSGFCKAHTKPILEFCGFAGDVKALQTDGSILRFTQGTLSNLDDAGDAPVFSQPVVQGLSLIAAHIPENACVPGNIAPTEIYAVHQPFGGGTNEFYHFDGNAWTLMGMAGANQTLTGMDGINSNKVIAVGREPDGGTNKGVSWLWNGTSWQQEVLPNGTVGLADIAFSKALADIIFPNGFEPAITVVKNKGLIPYLISWLIMGECGTKGCLSLSQESLNEFPTADLKVDKVLVDPIPPLSDANNVAVNDIITYSLKVTNLGRDFVNTAVLNDIYFSDQLEYTSSNNDCQPSLTTQGLKKNLSIGLANLAPGAFVICEIKFKVLSIPTQADGAVGVLNVATVSSTILDADLSNNYDVCLIDSNLANQPANRVQCEPELIWHLVF